MTELKSFEKAARMFKANTKFLIVDDYLSMRKIIKKTLSDIGYTNVVEAFDGNNAYEKLVENANSSEPIEFIICDWNMPKMLGIDFLKKCRSEKAYEVIPFVLVTAENDQSKIVEAVRAGVTDYVIKPFSPALLKSKFEVYYKKMSAGKVSAKVA